MSKPILCLDFDGVIHSYASGWKGADIIPDPPVPGAFKFIELAQQAFIVAVFSSRSYQPGGIEAMQDWFYNEMLADRWERIAAQTLLDQIQWPTEKPAAFLTIDDRALTFTGEWPDPEYLLMFKPWNKR